ncbi:Cyclic AMP receptor-like protein [Paenibacillus plantiphilus]|uniref:Cyclic AMP receptor-like protein n=1 Tax=Paenibacillus plantiphilus TaxID=2905650 RepID=A0ABM9C3L3_9BACL|nr:Crp/Fnr family transcriptional regulator [Paenibacillus plantiphilus]CAH1201569.1 Cyclic AMP receptor-like protein [Paenibacillus plantiphilus]
MNPQLLRDFPLFEHLDEEYLAEISNLCSERMYSKGESIFFEGDEGDELYLVISGVIQIYQDNHSRDVILSIFREGDYFGEMALLQKERVRSASARTIEKSALCILKKRHFIPLVKSKPEILIGILGTALDRLRDANKLITDLTILDVRTRIARMLLRLTEQHGVPSADGMLIDLKLTHQHLADMTGTARETVTKLLLDLQSEQLIRNDQKKIIVCNMDGLRNILDTI